MAASSANTFPWRILWHLRWGEASAEAFGAPHVREVRSTIVADLIALQRRHRRRARGDAARWLAAHPDVHDFLIWCEDDDGSFAIIEHRGAIGPILDTYLSQLRGE